MVLEPRQLSDHPIDLIAIGNSAGGFKKCDVLHACRVIRKMSRRGLDHPKPTFPK